MPVFRGVETTREVRPDEIFSFMGGKLSTSEALEWVIDISTQQRHLAELQARVTVLRTAVADANSKFGQVVDTTDAANNGLRALTCSASGARNVFFSIDGSSAAACAESTHHVLKRWGGEVQEELIGLLNVVEAQAAQLQTISNSPLNKMLMREVGMLGILVNPNALTGTPVQPSVAIS